MEVRVWWGHNVDKTKAGVIEMEQEVKCSHCGCVLGSVDDSLPPILYEGERTSLFLLHDYGR